MKNISKYGPFIILGFICILSLASRFDISKQQKIQNETVRSKNMQRLILLNDIVKIDPEKFLEISLPKKHYLKNNPIPKNKNNILSRLFDAYEKQDSKLRNKIKGEAQSYGKEFYKEFEDVMLRIAILYRIKDSVRLHKLKSNILAHEKQFMPQIPMPKKDALLDSILNFTSIYSFLFVVQYDSINTNQKYYYLNSAPFESVEKKIDPRFHQNKYDFNIYSKYLNLEPSDSIYTISLEGSEKLIKIYQTENKKPFLVIAEYFIYDENSSFNETNSIITSGLFGLYYLLLMLFLYIEFKKKGVYTETLDQFGENWVPSWWGVIKSTESVCFSAFLYFSPLSLPFFIFLAFYNQYSLTDLNATFVAFVLYHFFYSVIVYNEVDRFQTYFKKGTKVKLSYFTDYYSSNYYSGIKSYVYEYKYEYNNKRYSLISKLKPIDGETYEAIISPYNPNKARPIKRFY